jgi:hypothetical protein
MLGVWAWLMLGVWAWLMRSVRAWKDLGSNDQGRTRDEIDPAVELKFVRRGLARGLMLGINAPHQTPKKFAPSWRLVPSINAHHCRYPFFLPFIFFFFFFFFSQCFKIIYFTRDQNVITLN